MAVRDGVATIRTETGSGGNWRDRERGRVAISSPPVMPSLFSSSSSEDEEVMDEDNVVSVLRRPRRIWHEAEDEHWPEVDEEDDEVSESRRTRRRIWNQVIEEDDEEYMDEEGLRNDSEHEHEQGSHQQSSAVAPAPAPPDVRVSTRTAVANVTVSDADALDCGVCFDTLRPPIFQCEVGHVVCSACRDKLEANGNGKCHVCGVATRGRSGYRRCHAMEHLLDCIRVPCPYAAHGCDATPPYHGKESHRQVCPHAPCRCPGESCGFIGSTATLLDHFAAAHNWPCTTKVRAREAFAIHLRVGFNFILFTDQDHNDGERAAATGSSVPCRLFLLNVTRERLGLVISVLCIHPHANSASDQPLSTQCELVFSRYGDGSSCCCHYQSSLFDVVCTDLTNGLPNPEGGFQFIVPNNVLGVGDDKNSIQVKARIIN